MTTQAPQATPNVTVQHLEAGWQLARGKTGVGASDPAGSDWMDIGQRATVAEALARIGMTSDGIDDAEWWYRTGFEAARAAPDEEVVLQLDGLATVADVFLNGRQIVGSSSMFERHEVRVGDQLRGSNELLLRFRSLAPELAAHHAPRARWRTRIVEDGRIRWLRTAIVGRAPGFAPGPPIIGPWRPVHVERRRGIVVERWRLIPRLSGTAGELNLDIRMHALDGSPPPTSVHVMVDGPGGSHEASFRTTTRGWRARAVGRLRIAGASAWWPHTHGEPALYHVRARMGDDPGSPVISLGSTGFRKVRGTPAPRQPVERAGLALHLNGVPIFARGGLWTPTELGHGDAQQTPLRDTLLRFRDAGVNLVRVVGTGAYERREFHELCDELGIMVWQDLMFANMDYPFADTAFASTVQREMAACFEELARHPSTVVVCGNSEVEQQVAMLGLDPMLGRDPTYEGHLRRRAKRAGLDAVLIRSTPLGGDVPFRTDSGVAHYYGVGAYRRPVEDARAAGVRFAAECLAFSNLGDDAVPRGQPEVDAARRRGVPRDAGAGWDFGDVRDHYLAELYQLDPDQQWAEDPSRYLELSRVVTGEVMAAVIGEWRRPGSSCAGALVNCLQDIRPGAGWGVLDHRGTPKAAFHHLRRAFAPVAVWLTDEGLNGVSIHIANDRPRQLSTRLRVGLFRDAEFEVGHAEVPIRLAPHGGQTFGIEELLGRFVDVGWHYRFGPPAQDLIVATLETDDASQRDPLSQAFHFPVGRPSGAEAAQALGLRARVQRDAAGEIQLTVSARRYVHALRCQIPGFVGSDDAFGVEPGGSRRITLIPDERRGRWRGGRLRALNMLGSLELPKTVPT